jgi:hypothetical protein
LINTAWSWMSIPRVKADDFCMPTYIMDAVREVMGGIDLDAASHPAANFKHRIPEYFDLHRDAFKNDWFGKVWLNPPNGDYGPWFDRIEKYLKSGDIEQICVFVPVWAVNTKQAKTLMQNVTASVIFTEPPKMWGHPSQKKTGGNYARMIFYIGPHLERFIKVFSKYGVPTMGIRD